MSNNVNKLINEGVEFILPETCYVEEGVEIQAGAKIGSNTQIFGNSIISSGVYIEGGSLIINSTISEDTIIKLSSRIEDSIIGKNCMVGPFAHIRPKSVLKDFSKVGNFVETKNSTLEEGAKASHLTYLGDAKIGKDSNIGAGTITCNYDGKNKFETIIEDNVFVGSNSALVAPIKIGSGATVGAGSTIRNDIPKDSLAITSSDLKLKKDWKRP